MREREHSLLNRAQTTWVRECKTEEGVYKEWAVSLQESSLVGVRTHVALRCGGMTIFRSYVVLGKLIFTEQHSKSNSSYSFARNICNNTPLQIQSRYLSTRWRLTWPKSSVGRVTCWKDIQIWKMCSILSRWTKFEHIWIALSEP